MFPSTYNQLLVNVVMPERPYQYRRWRKLAAQKVADSFYTVALDVMRQAKIPVAPDKIRLTVVTGTQPKGCEPFLLFEWRVYTDLRSISEAARAKSRGDIRQMFNKEIWEHIVEEYELRNLDMQLPGDIFSLDKLLEEHTVAGGIERPRRAE
jgi:hypothetical protein